jgi:hypothetical protein
MIRHKYSARSTFIIMIILCCFYSLSSCNFQTPVGTLSAPDSVKNSSVLLDDFILKHTKEIHDTELKALNFLVENIKLHSTDYGKRSNIYMDTINKYYASPYVLREKLQALKTEKFHGDYKFYDVQALSKDLLLQDFMLSNFIYQSSPWQNKIQLDVFLEYLLPYRVDNELVYGDNWREEFRNKFMRDSLNISQSIKMDNIEATANRLHKWLKAKKNGFDTKFGNNSLFLPKLPLTYLDKLTSGSCRELSLVTIGYLRALGIPSTIDFTPNYLNLGMGHEWAVFFNSNKAIPFDIQNDSVGKFKHPDFKLSKVFRKRFSPVSNNHYSERGLCDFLPSFLNDPFLQDVTQEYGKVCDISIKEIYNSKNKRSQKTSKYVYLAVFGDAGWSIVDWGVRKNDRLSFKNIMPGGVYLALHADPNEMYSVSSAFLLEDGGRIKALEPNFSQRQDIRLFRKWPFAFQAPQYTKRMIGGQFQVSNFSDFRISKNIHTIDNDPVDTFNMINLGRKEIESRYVRYFGPNNSHANIAEMEVYRDGKNLGHEGKVIGSEGSMWNSPDWIKDKVFDGDELTYFSSANPDSSWVGLDFGKNIRIDSIRFLARNTKNRIYEGNLYELLCWDSKAGWISFGKIKAWKSSYLEYKDVPADAVFWLRNHSGGREERIFTMQEGKQVWW